MFTSVYDPAPWPKALRRRVVHTSFLDRVPGARSHYPKLLPLMNLAFESFDLSGFDLVVSSSHSCAKNVLTGPETLHVCYCHTPMRHAWEPRHLAGELGPAQALAARAMLGRLRRQDLTGASRPDLFVANSTHVAARIRKYYRRDAVVVHPPVDVERHLLPPAPRGRLLPRARAGWCRTSASSWPWAPAPRSAAASRSWATGRGLAAARAAAGPGAEFLGYLPDADVDELLSGARALLFPGEEDFGIVPVEAQAAGVPVIAYRRRRRARHGDRERDRRFSCRADRRLGRVRHPSS